MNLIPTWKWCETCGCWFPSPDEDDNHKGHDVRMRKPGG